MEGAAGEFPGRRFRLPIARETGASGPDRRRGADHDGSDRMLRNAVMSHLSAMTGGIRRDSRHGSNAC